jgi:ZIP family zinc transporter
MTHFDTMLLFFLMAGISPGLGAIPILFKKEFSKGFLDYGMGFSAGIMLVAAFASLIIPGIEQAKQIYSPHIAIFPFLISLLTGYLLIIIIHNVLPHEHFIKKNDTINNTKLNRLYLIIFAIFLHHFPEGLAVGVGFGAGSVSQGVSIGLAIAIQNMPEGLVVALSFLREGSTKTKALLTAFASGLIEPVAATIGYLSTKISTLGLPMALGFAGGCMLFVICQEIFPELFRQGHEKNATFGVISGISLIFLLNFYIVV